MSNTLVTLSHVYSMPLPDAHSPSNLGKFFAASAQANHRYCTRSLHLQHIDNVYAEVCPLVCRCLLRYPQIFKPNISLVSVQPFRTLIDRYQILTMASHHLEDEVIATYEFLSQNSGIPSAEPTTSDSSISLESTTSNLETIVAEPSTSKAPIFPAPTSSFTAIKSPVKSHNDEIRLNTVTIYKPHEKIESLKNDTHIAHVVFGKWNAHFHCKYDAPAGILHNASVSDMNDSMQKATSWSSEDDERVLTRKEAVEEQRALIKHGIYKKPRSETVGLCTLKEKDDLGWSFLELRTRCVLAGDNGSGGSGRDGDKTMVTSIAKKVVGHDHSTLAESR